MDRETKIRNDLVGRVDDLLADQFDDIERAAVENGQLDHIQKARATFSITWDVGTSTPHVKVYMAYNRRTVTYSEADLSLDQTDLFDE